MGYGNYDKDAYREITSTRVDKPKEEIFTQRTLFGPMDPRGLKVRESRDSDVHPNSIGIIFALDETGSMGDIPELLARKELPTFMETLIDGKFVADPQVMLMGIGDATTGEAAPLQVGQFECEAGLMDKWLTGIFLVGQGGGNGGESYDLAFYAAARHTSMDCWEKRGKKGYLFVTGDEPHLGVVQADIVTQLIGKGPKQGIGMAEIIKEAQKTFHCFFLIPDQARRSYKGCEKVWRAVLGDNVICMDAPQDTSVVAATLIGLTEGTLVDLSAARKKLAGLGKSKAQIDRVIKAVKAYAGTLPDRGSSGDDVGDDAGDEAPAPKGGGKKPGRI